MSNNEFCIGVLGLQGGYQAHLNSLAKCNATAILVKKPEDFTHIDGLIIPGGESSTLIKLNHAFNLLPSLENFHQQQKPIFGTCAGMILLARSVIPQQLSLNWIDILVERNAYGRQLDSFIAESDPIEINDFQQKTLELVFIRAPKVLEFSHNVTPLITHNAQPVLLRQQHVLAGSFHPELSETNAIHRYFIEMVKSSK